MIYRFVVAAACVGVFGCAAEDRGVTGDAEELTVPACEGGTAFRIGSLVVPSSEWHSIAFMPFTLHLVLADGVQISPAASVVTRALADEAMQHTAAEIMACTAPVLIADAVAKTAGDPSFTVCRWEWGSVTDFDTDEVVTFRDCVSPD